MLVGVTTFLLVVFSKETMLELPKVTISLHESKMLLSIHI